MWKYASKGGEERSEKLREGLGKKGGKNTIGSVKLPRSVEFLGSVGEAKRKREHKRWSIAHVHDTSLVSNGIDHDKEGNHEQ